MQLNYPFAVIGSGPTSQATIGALLDSNVRPEDIFWISSQILSDPLSSPSEPITFREAFDLNRDGAKSKKGREIHDVPDPSFSGSDIWGASCTPWPTRGTKHNLSESLRDYERLEQIINQFFFVQSEPDTLKSLYNQNGTNEGELVRKRLAHDLVSNSSAKLVGHSRLAIDSTKCNYFGWCMQGCADNAAWSASSRARDLINRRGMLLEFGRVLELDELQNHVSIKTVSGSVTAETVFVGAGWQETSRLLTANANRNQFVQTPVTMVPVWFDGARPEHKSFAFHDLLLPIFDEDSKNLEGLMQIYLPSAELHARMARSIPGSALGKSFLNKGLGRMGVAMIFHSNSAWNEDLNLKRNLIRRSLDIFNSAWPGRARAIPGIRSHLSNGASHHVGAWEPLRDFYMNMNHRQSAQDFMYSKFSCKRIFPIDTSILPEIPPGAHTFSAALLAWNLGKVFSQ